MLAALYWGSRKETLEACLACWRKTLGVMVRAGLHNAMHHDDSYGVDVRQDSPQTGLRYSWKSSDKPPEQLSLHVLCGAWASASNAVLLNVPDSGTYSFEKRAGDYLWAFSELIEVWDPLEGVVCRHEDIVWQGSRLSATSPCIQRYRRDAVVNTGVCLDGSMNPAVRDLTPALV